MANEALDAETIAAFLDGRLDADTRREVIERLARSPEALEILAESAGVRAELESGAPPIRAPGRWTADRLTAARAARPRRWWWFALPAAAVLAAILFLRNLDEGGATIAELTLVDGAALVQGTGSGALEARFGRDWLDPGWPVARGSGEPVDAAHTAAFRLGVRLADYEVAFGARDAAAIRRAGVELERMLDVQGAAPLARAYQSITRRVQEGADPASLDSERAAAAGAARELMDASAWWELGLWIEQARLAALADQNAFFAAGSPAMAALSRIAAALEADADAEAPALDAVRGLERSIAAGDTTRERLREQIAEVIRRSGRYSAGRDPTSPDARVRTPRR